MNNGLGAHVRESGVAELPAERLGEVRIREVTVPARHDPRHAVRVARMPEQCTPIGAVNQHTAAWLEHPEHFRQPTGDVIQILKHLT